MPRLIQLVLVAGYLFAGCRGVTGPEAGQTEPAAFVAAAGSGDVSTVRRAISAGIDVDAPDANGRTAVTAAALGGHTDVVRLLVDADADVDLQDAGRNNALLVCGETGNVEVLREVLRAGPDLTRTNRFGGTALIPAADRGHVEMVGALLETDIPIDHVNRLGWTALLDSVILGDGGPAHQEIVRLLIDAGANVELADRDGVAPLEHARRRGFSEIAKLLEQVAGQATGLFAPGHLRGEHPDDAYLKAVFTPQRWALEVEVQREPKQVPHVPAETEISEMERLLTSVAADGRQYGRIASLHP